MASFPPVNVAFDDGTEIRVEPKQRDMVRAEAAGCDFTVDGDVFSKTYHVAFAALQRLARSGGLPEGVTVPGSFDEFVDAADVESEDVDEDAEGNGSGQEASTGK